MVDKKAGTRSYWDQVCYMVGARKLEGPDGVYFRTAAATKAVTRGK